MKEYKVNLNNKEYIIKKDEDGLFIMPQELKQFEGFNVNLKPSIEPICVARKPLSEKTVADNILKWGVGGLNIDGCRVENIDKEELGRNNKAPLKDKIYSLGIKPRDNTGYSGGRWPANFIHDGSEEVVSLFPESKSGKGKANTYDKNGGQWGKGKQIRNADYGDDGSASRFFYCAKASKKDRNEGLDGFELKNAFDNKNGSFGANIGSKSTPRQNNHPTVKPTDLMAYLVRLVTPPNGTVLDPFNGSGSTGKACMRENFNYIGIDLSQEYLDISKARIEYELSKKTNNPE